MPAYVFQANTEGFQQLLHVMQFVTLAMVDDAFKVMRIGAEEYKRRVQRVVPRDTGLLSKSWYVDARKLANSIQIDMGTSRRADGGDPYAIHLELGTDEIADGKVKAWQPGMPVIMDWKAKYEGVANFRKVDDDEAEATTYRGRRTGRKFMEAGGGQREDDRDQRSYEIATGNFLAPKEIRRRHNKYKAAANLAFKQFTLGVGEQMPFIRPIGLDLAPRIVDAMWRAIRLGLEDALDGKKF
jgi:hypothetical protein